MIYVLQGHHQQGGHREYLDNINQIQQLRHQLPEVKLLGTCHMHLKSKEKTSPDIFSIVSDNDSNYKDSNNEEE